MTYEVLAPAGDEMCARAALLCGADAVYLGLNEFSAREGAENFRLSRLEEIALLAHLLGAKVYVCCNTLVKDCETDRFFETVRSAWNAGADAILIQDIFLGKRIKETYPEICLHLSTQAGVCSARGAEIAKEYGFSRVVPARETPLEEIEKIAKIIETETFVQGALCSCFSGQCYLSSFAGNNSGNRGRCKQPCRKRYAIDRKGYESFAYALSLSDLRVGARIKDLMKAGVTSFKIEGRMRSAEYVSAAVCYYRALLAGEETASFSSRLARAYNRGDYTEGLAFGQTSSLLSRNVQGHIGEKIGVVRLRGGKFFCGGRANRGDGLKILRGGKEVGGAVVSGIVRGGFYLASENRLEEGDEVRLTKEISPVSLPEIRKEISWRLYFRAGELPRAVCDSCEIFGDTPLEKAFSAPLTVEEIEACFQKTDGLPFSVSITETVADGVFWRKSALNAFRRKCYATLCSYLAPKRSPLPERELRVGAFCGEEEEKTAVLCGSFAGVKADILILKPQDYAAVTERDVNEGTGEKFLYLPPFLTTRCEEAVKEKIALFDGIYCDGFYGISLAKACRKPLFAGTGFHITNRFAAEEVFLSGAKYVALSKELSAEEQRALTKKNVFALSAGAVKVMDLCYCPFEKNCSSCDRREFYTLTDEDGRRFPLRRVCMEKESGACRFEVYNCVPIAAYNGESGALADATGYDANALSSAARMPQKYFKYYTKGHSDRSML